MFKRKAVKEVPRLVWRITAEKPSGEFVSPFLPKASAPDRHDVYASSLRDSSLDLRDGVELSEADITTLPGELLDELLKRRT